MLIEPSKLPKINIGSALDELDNLSAAKLLISMAKNILSNNFHNEYVFKDHEIFT